MGTGVSARKKKGWGKKKGWEYIANFKKRSVFCEEMLVKTLLSRMWKLY